MFGVLNFDKPAGWTSRDVVNRVQRLVRPAKVGHAGTLDPLATGVLLVCVGPATRLVQFAHRLPKHYCASFLLGRQSATDDVEGEVETFDGTVPARKDIVQALPQFRGILQQRPPAFSAIKVSGQRAYALARRGEQVELEPRPVQIHELELLDYEYPALKLRIVCGSGTYVRSLGRDLAQSLGTRAVMAALERTQIGPFQVDQAICPTDFGGLKSLDNQTVWKHALQAALQSPEKILTALPTMTVPTAAFKDLQHGRTFQGGGLSQAECCRWADRSGSEIAALDGEGRLLAVVKEVAEGAYRPVCNFSQPI